MLTKMSKQTQFSVDGYKILRCNNCWGYLGKQYLNERKIREIKCKKCGAISTFMPPVVKVKNGVRGVAWGVTNETNDSCWTSVSGI